MNRNTLFVTALACLTVIFVATTLAPAQQAPADAPPTANIGRYQLQTIDYGFQGHSGDVAAKRVVVIDTVTGQVWVKEDRHLPWRDYDSPAD